MDDSDHRPPPQGEASHAPAGPWLRQRLRAARREALPAAAFGLLGTLAAIGQALCAALVLQLALEGAGAGEALAPLLGFAGLALLRAGLGVLFERAGFDAQLLDDVASDRLQAPARIGDDHQRRQARQELGHR